MGTKLLAFFVAFVCVFAAYNSEGNRKLAESFLNNEVSGDVQEIDEDKVEQVWIYCQKELKYNAEAIKDLDLAPSQLSSKTIVQMAMAGLYPKEKGTILECLRMEDFPSQVPSYLQETSPYQDWLSDLASIPRRYLRGKQRSRFRNRRRSRTHDPVRDNLRVIKTSPIPGPALPPANFAPSLMKQVPSSPASFATSRIEQVPSPSPAPALPTPAKAPAPSDVISSSSPSDFNFHPTLPDRSFSPLPSHNTNIGRKYIIAAVIGSALTVLLLLLAFFLFFCFKKRTNKVQPNIGQRDENPLPNFCASDISAGSSQKSPGISNPSNKDFKAALAVGGLSDAANSSSKAESPSKEAQAVGKTDSTLPHPPGKTAPPATPPGPPPPPPKPPASAPPPPPIVGRPPPNPPKPSPLGLHHRRVSTGEGSEASDDSEAPKTKLKPFFWDKVLASPNHSMVWHEIKAGSFQFDEEMMKTLFGYVPAEKNKNDNKKDSSSFDNPQQFVQILDPKKSQNLAILLKALNVTTEEVCDALREGNELPAELIQTLLKMAPTTDEELKLRLYSGDVCHLGPAERFLKVVIDIPFAFKRLESLLFVSTFQEEVPSVKESFATLEVACKELRNSRLFLKLLEAVLKTGNRMNDGTYRGGAQAFKLDTLLKLSDVKGIDGKTTLLHFVVQEIIRSEGVRASRRLRESRSTSSVKTEDLVEDSTHEMEEYHRNLGLQVVSGLSNELENVRKAALIDLDNLREIVSKLGLSLAKTREFLDTEMKGVEGESEFYDALSGFVHQAESDANWLQEESKRITDLVRSTGDYFHGKSGRDEASHLFVIVRDFLLMLDKACKDVKSSTKLPSKMPRKETSATSSSSQESAHESPLDLHRRLFPAMRERELDDDFSSDDEN